MSNSRKTSQLSLNTNGREGSVSKVFATQTWKPECGSPASMGKARCVFINL